MVKRKAFLTFLSLYLVVSLSTTVLADPLSDLQQQKTNQQQQLEKDKKNLSDAQSRVDKLSMDLEKLDNQIEKQTRETRDNKKQIELVQAQIKNSEKEIKKAEDDIKDEQELFDKRIRNMYMNGAGGYLDVILDSKGFSDFLTRVEAVKVIVEYDRKVIGDLKDKKSSIVKQKEALDEKSNRLSALKAENEAKLAELNKNMQKQYDTLAILNNTVKELDKTKKNTETALANTNSKISELSRGTGTGGSTGPIIRPGFTPEVYTGSNPIVAFAYKYQGYKYVWGGKGPTYFDCSGFMWFVYKQFGYQIGGWTGEQRYSGTAVGRGELKEGDLIFFGDDFESIHHVGMYVGNNKYIHAPRTGDVIRVSSLGSRSDFVCARRIIK